MIISGGVPDPGLWARVNHVNDKKSVVNRIGAFVDEDKGSGWARVIDRGEFARIVELRQRRAAIFASVHPLVHGDRTNERITGTVDVNRVRVSRASIDG